MPWRLVLGIPLVIVAAAIVIMEWRLARLGYRPTMLNSEARWSSERQHASELGKRALILIGQSRILLDVDLDTIRQQTGLEPVQLAVDGNAPFDIVLGLAADPTITGTVLIDYYDYTVGITGEASARYQKYFEAHGREAAWQEPNVWTENKLDEFTHRHLLSYADGSNPYDSLTKRILPAKPAQHLLDTHADRSVLADFTQVPMPDYYYRTIAGNLGMKFDTLPPDIEATLKAKTAGLFSVSNIPGVNELFSGKVKDMKAAVAAIESHGARVIFAGMPTSGFVRQIESTQFPTHQFWDQFVSVVGSPSFRANDDSDFADFNCPDGSHLDYRDRPRFTALLVHKLGLQTAPSTQLAGAGTP